MHLSYPRNSPIKFQPKTLQNTMSAQWRGSRGGKAESGRNIWPLETFFFSFYQHKHPVKMGGII